MEPAKRLFIMGKKAKNILSIIFSTLFGAVLMVWIYRGFNFRVLSEVFTERGNGVWITLALAVGIVANVLRSLRWRMLLASADIHVRRRRAVELVFISYLINSVTPRLGELTRSLLVRRGDAEASTRAFGTVVVEKMADVVCLVLVVIAATALRWQDTLGLVNRLTRGLQAALPSYTIYIIAGCLVCLALGLTLPRVKHVRALLHNLWQGVSAIARLERPWSFAALCASIWLCNFLQLYLLVPCYDSLSSLGWVDALYIFATASVGVLLPTPGGVGPWHFAVVKTLTGLYGIPVVVAKSFALVTHGLKTVLVMILGALAYLTYYWEVAAKLKRAGGEGR